MRRHPSPRSHPLGGEGAGGFTLVEVLLAIAIAAAVLATTLGALRVCLAAWHRAEARAGRLDHARSVAILIERALDGASPYRLAPAPARAARVLFDGRADRLVFATVSPPLPGGATIAFTAVGIAGEAAGLALRQQALPDRLTLAGLAPVLVDPATRAARFRYLGETPGAWQEEWDMSREETLPRAVEVTLLTAAGARRTLTFAIRAAAP